MTKIPKELDLCQKPLRKSPLAWREGGRQTGPPPTSSSSPGMVLLFYFLIGNVFKLVEPLCHVRRHCTTDLLPKRLA